MDYDEVVGLLLLSGCVEPNNLAEEISMLKITKSIHNGQVFVTCAKPGVCEEWVKKLNSLEDTSIRKCHSYSDKEVTVKFSFIHPSIDIENEIVKKFLERKCGPVKEWSALRDRKYGIPNGSYVFIMQEEDLAKNPLPESIFLNHVQTFISYRTQVVICHSCYKPGHIASECQEQLFPSLHGSQGFSGAKNGVFLDGVFPRKPANRRSNQFVNKKDLSKSVSSVSHPASVSDKVNGTLVNNEVVNNKSMDPKIAVGIDGSDPSEKQDPVDLPPSGSEKNGVVSENRKRERSVSENGGGRAKVAAISKVVDNVNLPNTVNVVSVPGIGGEVEISSKTTEGIEDGQIEVPFEKKEDEESIDSDNSSVIDNGEEEDLRGRSNMEWWGDSDTDRPPGG